MPQTKPSILVVDDEPHVCRLIQDALSRSGLRCDAMTDSRPAAKACRRGDVDVLVADVIMPHVTGLELLALARRRGGRPRVILVTGVPCTESLAQALRLGAYDYLPKPFDVEALVRAVTRAAAGDDDADDLLPMKAARALQDGSRIRRYSLESIRALVRAVEAKDPYTRRHSEQVAHYAAHLAEHMQLGKALVETVRIASLLHDVGKIGTPDSILTKPGPLSEEEFAQVRRHPELGAEILEKMSLFVAEALLVRQHHENYDGSGYPDGLGGQEIAIGARIIRVADSVDAMLMERTYKRPYSSGHVRHELERGAGAAFDPDVVAACIQWMSRFRAQLVLPPAAA